MRARSLVAELPYDREAFTSRDFRDATGRYATGVNVITTSNFNEAYGMTASAFSSVSLDPPLVLVCIANTARGAQQIADNGVFAVNMLADDQEPISRYFANRDRPRGRDAFRDVPFRRLATGSPILDGIAGYVDCSLHATHEAGDHQIVVGEVLALGIRDGAKPLLFHGGGYCFLRD